MEHVHAVGTFVRFGGETFRTEARLHFRGGGEKSVLLIGMNPGACKLTKEDSLKMAKVGEFVTGEIVLDKTMKHIVRMMDEACPSFKGTLYMYNLFNARCGDMAGAMKLYAKLSAVKSFEPYLLTDIKECLKARTYSAVWLGWSLREQKLMNKRKKGVKQIIKSHEIKGEKIKVIAKYKDHDPNQIHVWHFRPLLGGFATEYRGDVIPQLREVLNDEKLVHVI
jgi:hypothetical protein